MTVAERVIVPWLSGVMSAPPAPKQPTAEATIVAQDEGGGVTHIWRDGAWHPCTEARPTILVSPFLLVVLAVALACGALVAVLL